VSETGADREALGELLQSQGWRLFCDYAAKTWEDEFNRRVMEAIGTKAHTPEQSQVATMRLQQAVAIREEIRKMIAWPKQQRDTLARADDANRLVELNVGRRPAGL